MLKLYLICLFPTNVGIKLNSNSFLFSCMQKILVSPYPKTLLVNSAVTGPILTAHSSSPMTACSVIVSVAPPSATRSPARLRCVTNRERCSWTESAVLHVDVSVKGQKVIVQLSCEQKFL